METRHAKQGQDYVVTMSGSMTFRDFQSSDHLISRIGEELESGSPPSSVVFDLSAVDMIDSHWLGVFVRILKRTEEKEIPVVLRRPQPPVIRLFKLVQFERVFRIEA